MYPTRVAWPAKTLWVRWDSHLPTACYRLGLASNRSAFSTISVQLEEWRGRCNTYCATNGDVENEIELLVERRVSIRGPSPGVVESG